MNKIKNKKSKIFLVINTGYFGDTILTAKLTRDIKTNYPESFLIFIADTPYVEIAKGLPGVDKVIAYDRKIGSNINRYIKFLLEFPSKGKIDVAFIAQRKKRSRNLLALLLGAKKIITFNKFSSSDNRSRFAREDKTNDKFCCLLANLLYPLTGKTTDNEDVEYQVPELSQKNIDDYLESTNRKSELIAINPMTSAAWKTWNICEAIKFAKLIINDGKTIVLTGLSKDNPQYIEEFDKEIGKENYINMVDKTSLAELGALYKRCNALISIDTGAMHMACAVGTPTIALFFNEIYRCWAPMNNEKNPYIYNPNGISAESVYEQTAKLIHQTNRN